MEQRRIKQVYWYFQDSMRGHKVNRSMQKRNFQMDRSVSAPSPSPTAPSYFTIHSFKLPPNITSPSHEIPKPISPTSSVGINILIYRLASRSIQRKLLAGLSSIPSSRILSSLYLSKPVSDSADTDSPALTRQEWRSTFLRPRPLLLV